MTTNLPPEASGVNDESETLQLDLQPIENEERAAEIVREVDTYYQPKVPFPPSIKRLYALLCIDAIDEAIKRRECLCLRCCTIRAGESAYALFCLRAEVLYRTGRSCSQTPHKPRQAT